MSLGTSAAVFISRDFYGFGEFDGGFASRLFCTSPIIIGVSCKLSVDVMFMYISVNLSYALISHGIGGSIVYRFWLE